VRPWSQECGKIRWQTAKMTQKEIGKLNSFINSEKLNEKLKMCEHTPRWCFIDAFCQLLKELFVYLYKLLQTSGEKGQSYS
jgi:hypothetical protein